MPSSLPPGPRFNLLDVMQITARQMTGRRQKINTLDDVMKMIKNYDGLMHFRAGHLRFYVLWRPDYVHEALVSQAASFSKKSGARNAFGRVMGDSLFTSDGELWRRQRKLLQPAFHHSRLQGYAQIVIEETRNLLKTWAQRGPYALDIDHEMMELTLKVVVRTLFHADIGSQIPEVGRAMTTLNEIIFRQSNSLFTVPGWMPTGDNLRQKQMLHTMEQIIYSIINARRESGEDCGDVLSMLLAARYEDGSAMSDRQIRDEVMMFFTAGHETTALALTWAWFLLAQHPEAEAALHAELGAVLGERVPTFADLEQMPYTRKVVKETLRLCPPIPVIPRRVLHDVQIGGCTLLKGSTALFFPYAAHRDANVFEQPERFWPERWTPEMEQNLPSYAYFPFGGGPRVCMGHSFAMMEARLILATVAQQRRLSLLPGQHIEMHSFMSIRPRYGMRMAAQFRTAQPEIQPA